MKCRICGSIKLFELSLVSFRQSLFLFEFEYYKCSACGCLQIKKFPENINDLYSESYESFAQEKSNTIKDRLYTKKILYQITGKGILGKFINELYEYGNYEFLRGIKTNDTILDIGCGGGKLVKLLRNLGYCNVKGIDPFLSESKTNEANFLYATDLMNYCTDEKYSIIMLNHSFEHMDNPKEVISKIKSLIKEDGVLSIEIPIINDYLWEKYGLFIDSLDPPYHYFIHTIKSMKILLEEQGFKITEVSSKISPLLEDFVYRNRDKLELGKNSLFNTAMKTLTTYKSRKRLNHQNQGNIARFICKLSVYHAEEKDITKENEAKYE